MRKVAVDLLKRVDLPREFLDRYPKSSREDNKE